jgi:hypothetical protein
MYRNKLVALCGAIAMLGLAATPALAAGGPRVTVRVEGVAKTLELPTQVTPGAGSLTRYGAPKGSCSRRSGAGALDLATHHKWKGTWDKSFSDYEITSILGEKHSFTSKYYWEVFVNNVSASTGACGIKLHSGESLLFAAVPIAGAAEYPLGLSATHSVVGGKSFTVKVVSFNAAGKAKPLAGAVVTGRGVHAVTNSKGVATIAAQKHGTIVLHAKKKGYVRAAPVAVVVA